MTQRNHTSKVAAPNEPAERPDDSPADGSDGDRLIYGVKESVLATMTREQRIFVLRG
jgi:hypothetical protein